jgi:hypothetical protein
MLFIHIRYLLYINGIKLYISSKIREIFKKGRMLMPADAEEQEGRGR